jgi:phenylalanyl-tRNA synthetase beta chain
VSVRTTSRALTLPSEASFRFERFVDIERIDWASRRTAQLIVQVAGGRVAKGVVDAYPRKPERGELRMRLPRLNLLLGVDVPQDDVLRILSALYFEPRLEGDAVVCTAPTWRSDIEREVDLIEEVARVYGYNNVPTQRKIHIEAVPTDPRQGLAQSVGGVLNAYGFHETVTVAFVNDTIAGLFMAGEEARHLSVGDVSRKHENLLRQTLLGSLLGVLKTNVNAKNLPCRIYELADTFVPSGPEDVLPEQQTKLGMVIDGSLRELRGAVEGVVGSIDRHAVVEFAPAELAWAEVGADVRVNGRRIGAAGVFSDAVRDKLDFKEVTPCGAELSFAALAQLDSGPTKITPIPRFPAVERDLSIVVDEETPWADIAGAVQREAPGELEAIHFVDIYRGKGIEPNKKSVTLSLRFRDEDGTLTHETVDGYQAAIVEELSQAVGAHLRTA